MKTLIAFAAAIVLSASVAMAAPTSPDADPAGTAQTTASESAEATTCSKEDQLAGACHKIAEPCLENSECCSGRCDGSCY